MQTEKIADWEKERNRNRVALGTLLQIDPHTQQVQIILRRIDAFNIQIQTLTEKLSQRVLFTQEVMILQIDKTQDWYYEKCDECGGKLRYGFVHGHCHQYGTQPKPEKRYIHIHNA